MNRMKPLSMEEKTKRILELLQKTETVFTLKELEKIAPKEKGVVTQSVKEALEILVSENKVKEEKIGQARYYWSFVSDQIVNKENKKKGLEEELAKKKEQLLLLTDKLRETKQERQSGEKRRKQLELLQQNKKQLEEVQKELALYEENSPEQLEQLENDLETLKQDTNAYTDHIFTLKSYVCNELNVERNAFDTNFHVPADLDYVT